MSDPSTRPGEGAAARAAGAPDFDALARDAIERIAHVGTWLADFPTRTLKWSPEAYRQLGYAPGEVTPSEDLWFSHVHPEDRERLRASVDAVAVTREKASSEFRIVRVDGSIRYMHGQTEAQLDASGEVRGFLGTVQDITERRLAEQELAVSEQRFRVLSQASHDAIWDADMSTGLTWWSEGLRGLFGYAPEEMRTAQDWVTRIHPDDVERVIASAYRPSSEGDALFNAYRFYRKDGSLAWVESRGLVVRDDAGRPARLIGGLNDVTAQHEAQARIAAQAALLDAARDAIMVHDLAGRVSYWNRSAERLYGWTAAEAVGREVSTLLGDDGAKAAEARAALMREGAWSGTLRRTTRAGATLEVEGRWTLVAASETQAALVLVIDTDVTEEKRRELQRLRSQRMESLGTLAGGMAHDLNNVLAPVLMSVGLLRAAGLGERQDVAEAIDTIESCTRRGADLVRRVLAFARGLEGERTPLCPRRLVQDLARLLGELLPKRIVLEVVVAEELSPFRGDATQIHQVLMNLCLNARDAMPEAGRLRLSARMLELAPGDARLDAAVAPGAYVAFEVQDDGTGMSSEVLARVFEPFFTTKALGHGTGLGLATAQGIVKGHGGFISCESEPGAGSTFRVLLPADRGALPLEPATRPAKKVLPRGRGELVLIVDDEAPIRRMGARILGVYGYRSLIARDGAEALRIFEAHLEEIAVVVTDMMMPVMDGPAMIAALRAVRPDVRVIAASGLNAAGEPSVPPGVACFLAKPYTPESLLDALDVALGDRG